MIRRAYANAADGRRIHYRRAGAGPPLVLLHASRGSSWALEPRIAALAAHHTVIALDTPGSGESEPLAIDRPTIDDYASATRDALDALGLKRVDLYGTHTGAKIALAVARRFTERVRRVVVDGLAIYTADERAEMVAKYTPSLDPEPDATHWVRGWAMVRNLHIFWPWFRRDRHSRIVADLPSADDLHAQFVDLMRAVPGYERAYRAAFDDDGLRSLRQTIVPVLLTAAATDPLANHLDRASDMPDTVRREPPYQNLAAGAAGMLAFLDGDPLLDAPPPPVIVPVAGAVRRDYADTRVGQVLLRKSGSGTGRPILLFHGSPGTSRSLEPLLQAFGEDRPAITFDTPGLGDSASPATGATMADVAAILGDAIDTLSLDEFDIYGSRTGSCTGIELAISRPTQVRRLIVDGPVLFTAEYAAWLIQQYLPPIVPHENGSHLLLAWNFRRDQALFWPWFNHTAAGVEGRLAFTSDHEANGLTGAALHRGLSDFLKGALTYHIPYRAGIIYPARDRLPLVSQPVLLCTNEHDLFRPGLAEACALTRHHQSRIYPDAGPPDALPATIDLFRRFLAGEPLPLVLGTE